MNLQPWHELTKTQDGSTTVTTHHPQRFITIQPIDDLPELTPQQFATLAEGCYLWALQQHKGTFDPRYELNWITHPLDGNLRLLIWGCAFRTKPTQPIPRSEWSRY